jgi:hypothetical protein
LSTKCGTEKRKEEAFPLKCGLSGAQAGEIGEMELTAGLRPVPARDLAASGSVELARSIDDTRKVERFSSHHNTANSRNNRSRRMMIP